jgi:hypothetical protein
MLACTAYTIAEYIAAVTPQPIASTSLAALNPPVLMIVSSIASRG